MATEMEYFSIEEVHRLGLREVGLAGAGSTCLSDSSGQLVLLKLEKCNVGVLSKVYSRRVGA